MKKTEPKGHQKLKGYTVYLTKQASKLLGTPTIEVEGGTYPNFDSTREMWQLPYLFELSKESVLIIEYHHEETKEWFAKTGSPKIGSEENKQKPYSWKAIGSSIDAPTPMFASEDAQEEFDKTLVEELNKSLTKEINDAMKIGSIKL